MPSAKRERIRANQARVRAEREAIKKKNNRKRRSITVAVAVVVVIGVVYFINRSNNASSTKKLAAGATLTAAQASVTCPPINGSTQRITHFTQAPPMCISTNKTYVATVKTDVGTFKIKLDPKTAPLTTNNFVFLARYRFFDGIIFHRVIPGFVVQGGDPTGTGTGGPGYRFRDELPEQVAYEYGTLAMANAGPNTNGSQFFIVSGPSGQSLPPLYSIFGKVQSGLDVVASLDAKGSSSGKPTEPCVITSINITESDKA